MVSTDKCTLLCLFNSKKELLPWIFLFSGVKYKTLAVFSIVGRFSDNLRTVKSSRSLHKLLVSEKKNSKRKNITEQPKEKDFH